MEGERWIHRTPAYNPHPFYIVYEMFHTTILLKIRKLKEKKKDNWLLCGEWVGRMRVSKGSKKTHEEALTVTQATSESTLSWCNREGRERSEETGNKSQEVEIIHLGSVDVKESGWNQRCLPSIWLEQVGGDSEIKLGEENISDGRER